jgi:hypothetical protein
LRARARAHCGRSSHVLWAQKCLHLLNSLDVRYVLSPLAAYRKSQVQLCTWSEMLCRATNCARPGACSLPAVGRVMMMAPASPAKRVFAATLRPCCSPSDRSFNSPALKLLNRVMLPPSLYVHKIYEQEIDVCSLKCVPVSFQRRSSGGNRFNCTKLLCFICGV